MTESRTVSSDLCGLSDTVVTGSEPDQWALDITPEASTFRAAMRRVVSGLTVVTTWHEDRPWGMTVNAFASVCMEPPTVLVCVNNRTATAADISRNGRFAANLLSEDQLFVSRLCSRPGTTKYIDDYVLAADDLPPRVAAPVLGDSLVTFDCEVSQAHPVGTHFVVIGTVRAVLAPEARPALLFGEGRYQRGVDFDEAPARAGAVA